MSGGNDRSETGAYVVDDGSVGRRVSVLHDVGGIKRNNKVN